MSVDYTTALMGTLLSSTAIHNFQFSLRFTSPVTKGSPESGECLDAQSFEIGDSLAMIGTEDGESPAARHRWFNLSNAQYPIGYLDDGLELGLNPANLFRKELLKESQKRKPSMICGV